MALWRNGRRGGLKIRFRKESRFESGWGYPEEKPSRALLGFSHFNAIYEDMLKTIKEIQDHWAAGNISRGEAKTYYCDYVGESNNISKSLNEIPLDFRSDVYHSLRNTALYPANEEVFFVMGGIYAYECESDPIKKAQMKKEVEDREKAKRDYYNNVIRPKIRAWWAKENKRHNGL